MIIKLSCDMENFVNSMFIMGMSSTMNMDNFDVLGRLPNEVGSMILRYLDGESLLKAATVSKRWNSLCRGDKKLRQRGRQQLRMMKKRKKEQIYGTLKRSSYVPVDEVPAFRPKTSRNVVQNVQPQNPRYEEPVKIVTQRKRNILQSLSVNVKRSPARSHKSKSLTSQQKRRLLRH